MKRLVLGTTLAGVAFASGMSACGRQQAAQGSSGAPQPAMTNTLTAEEAAAGWRLLFDGRTVSGWRAYHSQDVPSDWHVVNGTLTKEKPTADLITRDKFADFELALDWKLGPGGNSGIFYRGTEEFDHIYWSGPEYQLLDDAGHPDGHSRFTSAGAAYGIYPSPAGIVKPADEWNSTRLVVNGNHVEHWLNGVKLLEYELASPDWEARVKASKFTEWPQYGRARRGYIGIQGDHDGVLAIRNVRIRELSR